NFTISNLDNIAQNIQASESTIRDADFAQEITNFTKSQILVQAGTAMLAQANTLPQNVLALLGR
ncbi:flagellin FliC, partial [Candidatus Poribacteria bacterium]|nr:flagellin FliC [Candidatus Poribacteria bacterium]